MCWWVVHLGQYVYVMFIAVENCVVHIVHILQFQCLSITVVCPECSTYSG
jgi:hypothetical protein